MDLPAPVAAAPPPARMHFSGDASDFFRILFRGSLLQIPTAGFYRFWLITDIRRHFWSHTQIGDDAFEYTGLGRELLIGFLIAMAVLVPIYLGYFLLTLEAERQQAFASVPLVAILYLVGHYAVFRARRYRASRTIFRGVRFFMTGSGLAYLGRAIVWDLLTILTLGFAYAWRAASLERYKMDHTRYGSIAGGFVASGWTLFKRGAWLWAIFLLVAGTAGALALAEHWGWAIFLAVAVGIPAPILLPVFRAIELRWWLEGIRLGRVEAISDLKIGAVVKCHVKTLLAWMLYGALGGIVAGIVVAIGAGAVLLLFGGFESVPEGVGLPAAVIGGVLGALIYFAFLLGFDIIRRIYLDRGVWAAAVASVTLINLDQLDEVVAAGGELPSGVGEGLLDALDMGGGF